MPYLKITDRDGSARTFALSTDEPELYIGRHPGCTIALDGPAVAPFHCQLTQVDGGHVLRAEPGGDGFAVDGHNLTEQRLAEGVAVDIGGFVLTFHAGTAAPSAADADAGSDAADGRGLRFAALADEPVAPAVGKPSSPDSIAQARQLLRAGWPVAVGLVLAAVVYLKPLQAAVMAEQTAIPTVGSELIPEEVAQPTGSPAPPPGPQIFTPPSAPSTPPSRRRTPAKRSTPIPEVPVSPELQAARDRASELIREGLKREGADQRAEAIALWRDAQALLASDDEIHLRAARLLREVGVRKPESKAQETPRTAAARLAAVAGDVDETTWH